MHTQASNLAAGATAYPGPSPHQPASVGAAYPGQAPVPTPHASAFEFGPEHDSVIARTASRMQAFGVISVVVGALQVLGSLATIAASIVALGQTAAGVVSVFVGVFFLRGAERLRAVVKTSGDDVGHLMRALQSVGHAFLVQVVAMLVAFLIASVLGGLAAAGLL